MLYLQRRNEETMAKESSLIRIKGAVDGFRYYHMKGHEGLIVGRVGGPSASQVKKSPSFARLRENGSEFGQSARISKSIRQAWSVPLMHMGNPRNAGRMNSKVRAVIQLDDEGRRGYRSFRLSKHKGMLTDFQLMPEVPFDMVMKGGIEVKSPDGKRVSVDLKPMVPESDIRKTKGATHFQISVIVSCVSDYAYDEEKKQWKVLNEGNGTKAEAKSSYISVEEAFGGESMTIDLPIADTTDATTVVTVSFEFYQKSGSKYYLLRDGACGKVVAEF